jgi:hypothetical protein
MAENNRWVVVVTDKELEELWVDCPSLFHMAEKGSWLSIHERGLLSTSALLDLYQIKEPERCEIERRRRPRNVALNAPGLPEAVIRDQIPMDDIGLQRALPKDITPANWYSLLNGKVFFWLTRERLQLLLGAGAYREKSHDVIEVRTRSLMQAYYDRIWLCPMNSGCTKPFPHPRDDKTFRRIPDYPYSDWRRKRRRGERVVELAVDHGIPDIEKFVVRVVEMRGPKEIRALEMF